MSKTDEPEEEFIPRESMMSPDYKLWGISRQEKIKMTPNTWPYYLDSSYTMYDPFEDFLKIKRAISVAKLNPTNRASDIIAIQLTRNKPPIAYYIRNDLLYRKKKTSTVKPKRKIIKKSKPKKK